MCLRERGLIRSGETHGVVRTEPKEEPADVVMSFVALVHSLLSSVFSLSAFACVSTSGS